MDARHLSGGQLCPGTPMGKRFCASTNPPGPKPINLHLQSCHTRSFKSPTESLPYKLNLQMSYKSSLSVVYLLFIVTHILFYFQQIVIYRMLFIGTREIDKRVANLKTRRIKIKKNKVVSSHHYNGRKQGEIPRKDTWCTPITLEKKEKFKQKRHIDLPQVLKDPKKEKIEVWAASILLSYINIKIINYVPIIIYLLKVALASKVEAVRVRPLKCQPWTAPVSTNKHCTVHTSNAQYCQYSLVRGCASGASPSRLYGANFLPLDELNVWGTTWGSATLMARLGVILAVGL